MDAFWFALSAVVPLILVVALGYFLKTKGLLSPSVAKTVNKIVFRILIPATVFLNIYKIEDVESIDLTYIFYVAVATLIIFALSMPLACLITKKADRRGVVSQVVYRSNYALIGLPLVESICGSDGLGEAALLSVVSVTFFNVFAVISLSVFGDGTRKVSVKKILLDIVKNPLIQAIAAALVALAVRAVFVRFDISFRFSDITPLFTAIKYLSSAATPIALLCLGAQFEFSAIKALRKEIIWGVMLRTVIVPALGLGIAYLFFDFTAGMFAALIATFATPVSVSSAPMAQEMGGDGELAGQLVLWSTAASGLTLFGFIYALKLLGAL